MWKTIGRWTLGMASSVMLTVPALGARADESQQMQNNAAQAGQQMKNAGQNAGNAAESTGHAAGNAAQGAWDSSKNAAQSAGDTAEQTGHRAAGAVDKASAPTSDEGLTSQVKQKLSAAEPSVTNVEVRTKKDVVTLSGTVTSEAARTQAVDIARQVDGVKQVKDHIEVNPSQ